MGRNPPWQRESEAAQDDDTSTQAVVSRGKDVLLSPGRSDAPNDGPEGQIANFKRGKRRLEKRKALDDKVDNVDKSQPSRQTFLRGYYNCKCRIAIKSLLHSFINYLCTSRGRLTASLLEVPLRSVRLVRQSSW